MQLFLLQIELSTAHNFDIPKVAVLSSTPHQQQIAVHFAHRTAHASPMPPLNHHLLPRGSNDNGTANSNLSDGAIIIIVLVAAGFAVLVGFSITRFYFDKDQPDKARPLGDEQLQYMHSVRRRNLEFLGYGGGVRRSEHRGSESVFSDAEIKGDGRG